MPDGCVPVCFPEYLWGPIVCVMCESITDDWVVWGAAYVEEVFYFCNNACLARWLVRQQPDVEECHR